jgi:hypothetical protein
MGKLEELQGELRRLSERVAMLERENADLRREDARLREALEEARRGGKRQAAPFSRGKRNNNPKKPGRKAGSAYGSQAHRAVPKQIDKKVTVDCLPFALSPLRGGSAPGREVESVSDRCPAGRADEHRVRDSLWPLHPLPSPRARTGCEADLRCERRGGRRADRAEYDRNRRAPEQDLRNVV